MSIIYSFLLGLGICFVLLLSPIIAGIFGRLVYGVYIGISLGVASWDSASGIDLPKWPYVILSILAAMSISNFNAKYAQEKALSRAPERAAGAMVCYVIFLIIGLVYRLF
jgi:hypothetical protein